MHALFVAVCLLSSCNSIESHGRANTHFGFVSVTYSLSVAMFMKSGLFGAVTSACVVEHSMASQGSAPSDKSSAAGNDLQSSPVSRPSGDADSFMADMTSIRARHAGLGGLLLCQRILDH